MKEFLPEIKKGRPIERQFLLIVSLDELLYSLGTLLAQRVKRSSKSQWRWVKKLNDNQNLIVKVDPSIACVLKISSSLVLSLSYKGFRLEMRGNYKAKGESLQKGHLHD